ncbi:MAG: hypothetical protein JSW39_10810, partial [Desulfobacterales bacterium]
MPDTPCAYWNPWLETLPREKLVQIELKNFRQHLRYAQENSPYHRARYKDIAPEEIRTIEDVRGLPLMDKKAAGSLCLQEAKDVPHSGESVPECR